ncbi:MAG: hypothetical protein KGJ09_07600 [Candidatus Omnitrophica bacterium]|nr:hypothetical protein [Candidatus Omnitrophota bacterium]MDE2009925.1 hypothetical protein [Candidatus Omnitrophota bacterium]MDE2215013.1 hypothetical protein [Candidatus Omnitrophota bacterium]MDE2232185.1 hypothetical protein [Candidatus Omnitrophota bacterium]
MFRIVLCLLLVTAAGCGYTTGSLLPGKYKKITILPFRNKISNFNVDSSTIYVPGLETQVTTAIIDRFLFDGNLRVVKPQEADLILSGALTGIAQDELRQDVNQNVQEYRIRIIVAMTLKDAATGKVLWREPSFTGESTYFLTGPQAQSQSSAISTALTDLATRAVERTVENW